MQKVEAMTKNITAPTEDKDELPGLKSNILLPNFPH